MLSDFQQSIGYRFNDSGLLMQALTHSSYAHENKIDSLCNNERLEFLGDAVLELVISEFLYLNFHDMPEGELTRFRAGIVCEQTLSTNARVLGLGRFLRLGRGEDLTGGRERDSILADAFESVIGAIYLDGGLEAARVHILKFLTADVEKMRYNFKMSDCKTYLQELIQKHSREPITYIISRETGPDHDKVFESQAIHNNVVLGIGTGKSKKEAEQDAAYRSIQKILKS